MIGAAGDCRPFLIPSVAPAKMLDNMRTNSARGLKELEPCRPHPALMSVAAGGPSLADTYKDLAGYIVAVNGSLGFLLEKGIVPDACAVLDPGEHMSVVADKRVRYFIASICDPSLFDKLRDCDVTIWHPTSESIGVEYPETLSVGGGCTMGLRWLNLGYLLGFRRFHLHGLDSSFRETTHAYPDRADSKERITVNGRQTRFNFLAQVNDFFDVLDRFSKPDIEPVEIEVFGDGLLQDEWKRHRRANPNSFAGPVICCVKTGDKYGDEYVTNLRDGVARHFGAHQFVCFTDRPVDGVLCKNLPADLPGWFAKLGLFRLGRPLVYFDLDVVITGSLDPIRCMDRFTIIKDWWLPGFNSSVMVLTGKERNIWYRFSPDMIPRLTLGDQQYITEELPGAHTFPPNWFPSYKANDCREAPSLGAIAVIFHGNPKPHELGGWVNDTWRANV
jgi:hypothetical protein